MHSPNKTLVVFLIILVSGVLVALGLDQYQRYEHDYAWSHPSEDNLAVPNNAEWKPEIYQKDDNDMATWPQDQKPSAYDPRTGTDADPNPRSRADQHWSSKKGQKEIDDYVKKAFPDRWDAKN